MALATAVPAPVANPEPAPIPQVYYGGYPTAYSYGYPGAYYGWDSSIQARSACDISRPIFHSINIFF